MLDHREDYDKLLKAITGIIFLDVPNRGMDILSLEPFIDFIPNKASARAVASGSSWQDRLDERFFRRIDWNLDIVIFYAMQKSPVSESQKVRVLYRIYQAIY
jgi:hypothetical protein